MAAQLDRGTSEHETPTSTRSGMKLPVHKQGSAGSTTFCFAHLQKQRQCFSQVKWFRTQKDPPFLGAAHESGFFPGSGWLLCHNAVPHRGTQTSCFAYQKQSRCTSVALCQGQHAGPSRAGVSGHHAVWTTPSRVCRGIHIAHFPVRILACKHSVWTFSSPYKQEVNFGGFWLDS